MQTRLNIIALTLRHSLCLLLICLALIPLRGFAQVSTEYTVKAVFLFRFAEFVEWPPDAFSTSKSPIVFGVLGLNPFGNSLRQAVLHEQINGRSLVVKEFRRVQDIDLCHVLFISPSEAAKLPQILTALKGRGILTVGDSGNFIAEGGMIQFITEGNHVRFRINRNAAEAEKLKLSSKLLRLAL